MYLVYMFLLSFATEIGAHWGHLQFKLPFYAGRFIRGGLIPPDFAGQTNTWYYLLRVSKICRSNSHFFDYLLFPVQVVSPLLLYRLK